MVQPDQGWVVGPKATLVSLYERAQELLGAARCRPVPIRWSADISLPTAQAVLFWSGNKRSNRGAAKEVSNVSLGGTLLLESDQVTAVKSLNAFLGTTTHVVHREYT